MHGSTIWYHFRFSKCSRSPEILERHTYILTCKRRYLLTSEAIPSVVYQKNLSISGPAHADAFERLISLVLCIRFPYGLHRGIGPFKTPLSQSDLAYLGVTLAGSVCLVKEVKIGRYALTQEWLDR